MLKLLRVLHEGMGDVSSLPQRLADTLCQEGGFAGVALLLLEGSGKALVGVAHAGISARYPAGRIPRGRGVSWEAVTKRRGLYVPNLAEDPRVFVPGRLREPLSGLFLPLLGRLGPVGAMVVHAPAEVGISSEDRTFLEQVASPVALALENALLYEHLQRAVALRDELLQVTRALTASELDVLALCQRVVAEAVRLVPGAERASLSVREGEEFVFMAAVGYDLVGLRGVRFTEEDRLRWYGMDQASLLAGRPRLLDGEEARRRAAATRPVHGAEAMDRHGDMNTLKVTLGVPIVLDGRLEAFLNLDSHTDPDAFGDESVEVATIFGHQVAAILKGARLRALLAYQATTDALTGVHNRRYMEQRLREELARAERTGQPFCFALLDVVGLKRVNDTLGHGTGDRVLQEVAQHLRDSVRASDVVCRYGGDEFAVLLAQTRPAEAARALGRVLRQLAVRVGPWGDGIWVSAGVAAYPEDGRTQEALAAAADRRMYRARQLGVHVCKEG
ncbi:MAG: diguanylate cyclase [Armatimonadota bacterium]|nr:diguanylate cyclase [Armatimonadota bacterium]MDW8157204.1 diguanylate cyclase [Armatimonadota bacterium]